MKKIFTSIFLMFISLASIIAQCPENFHNFSAVDIHGNNLDMSTFAGKKVLVVNTASYCGYTGQYSQLQYLYDTYGGTSNSYNFEIIGFPANNFQNQEPYNEDSIQNVCNSYGITFTMMSKISVKGTDQHEIYKWLTLSSQNCVQNATVTWNFQKFMINPDGSWHGTVAPATSPTTPTIVNWITGNTSLQTNETNNFSVYLNEENTLLITNKNNNTEKLTVKIINMAGQKLVKFNLDNSTKNSTHEISLNKLPKGIYLIHITNKNISQTEKLFVK